jgi:hypothetical protein
VAALGLKIVFEMSKLQAQGFRPGKLAITSLRQIRRHPARRDWRASGKAWIALDGARMLSLSFSQFPFYGQRLKTLKFDANR